MAHTNGAQSTGSQTHITLYTNHGCPWAHRAHIALKELGLQYEEVIIDLDTPRPDWYLKINPRGLVPSIKYGNEIITESAIVTQFLADLHPHKHLLPASNTVEGALFRARVNFFVDAVISKVQPHVMAAIRASGADEKAEKVALIVKGIQTEVEPLLKDAKPFFLGNSSPTLAEVNTAPFVLRLYAFARDGDLIPSSLLDSLAQLPHFTRWAKAVVELDSVTYIWNADKVVGRTKARFAK